MKKILFLIALCLFSFSIISQTVKKDLLEDLNKQIGAYPNDPQGYFYRANYYYDKKQYEPALKDYDKAIELDSTYSDAYLGRGVICFLLNRFNDAIDDFTEIIRKKDTFLMQAYSFRAMSYYKIGDFKGCFSDYKQAAFAGDSPYKNIKNLNSRLKSSEGEIEKYTKIMELDPSIIDVYIKRAQAYFYRNDYEKAIDDYSKAISLDSEKAELYFQRGNIYLILGKYKESFYDFNQAIKLGYVEFGFFKNVYFYRGISYYEMGNFKEAIDDFSKVIKFYNENSKKYPVLKDIVTPYIYRYELYDKLGDSENSKKDLDKIKYVFDNLIAHIDEKYVK